MKNTPILLSISLLLAACLLIPMTGCFKDGTGPHLFRRTIYVPVYGSKTGALAAINGNAGKGIESVGKIYMRGAYIFISEPEKGIHIIDNSIPSHPSQTAFLAIPGNQDIAIKGNILYADMYADLLAIDITDLHQAKITGKIEGLFAGRTYVNGYASSHGDDIVTDWQTKDTLMPATVVINPGGGICLACNFFTPASSVSATGIAGSMAKMVLMNDHLFAITEQHTLGVINITEASYPTVASQIYAGFDLETIYPFQDKLFLGSNEGVYIYDIGNPASPVLSGTFGHGRACDPVVTDGKYAYVTLHAGSMCGGASNELDVLNLDDLTNPALVKSYPMTSPKGLCKDGDLLFVCDGNEGVKVYNANDPASLRLLQLVRSGPAHDVIAANKQLFIVSDKGLYQYSYSNGNDTRFVSLYAAGKN